MTDIPAFEREYDVEGLDEKIVVRIYEPRLGPGDWLCEHRLAGPGRESETSYQTPGVDKLEALTTTLRRISLQLKRISEDLDRQVTWLGEPRLPLI